MAEISCCGYVFQLVKQMAEEHSVHKRERSLDSSDVTAKLKELTEFRRVLLAIFWRGSLCNVLTPIPQLNHAIQKVLSVHPMLLPENK
jgi:hypothetical protein